MPRALVKISAKALCEHLSAADLTMTKHTVERDLNAISQVFPIQGWRHTRIWNKSIVACYACGP